MRSAMRIAQPQPVTSLSECGRALYLPQEQPLESFVFVTRNPPGPDDSST